MADPVTKTLRDGRTATITAYISLDRAWARAEVDGEVLGKGIPGRHPKPPAPMLTHRLGRLVLTSEEFEQVMAMLRLAQAEHDETTEGAKAKLHREREALVNDLAAAVDVAQESKARAFDAGQLDTYFQTSHAIDEAEVASAADKLAEFDRRHPEIRAELESNQARRAAERMWD